MGLAKMADYRIVQQMHCGILVKLYKYGFIKNTDWIVFFGLGWVSYAMC
jgi:hypothetical protein